MPNSPPQPQSPQSPTKKDDDLDPQNPNPSPDFTDPPENPQTSTSETQNPPPKIDEFPLEQQNPDQNQQEEPQIVEDDQEQDDPEPELSSQEGMMIVTLSPDSKSLVSDTQLALESKGTTANNRAVTSARRGPKRKKGLWKNRKSQEALEKKLETISQHFKPIPFVPGKALDFSRHEELLKKLGLWEFAHIVFDRNLRADLIAKLVVNYNSKQRNSHVNDVRIGVNRAELTRALKLPKLLVKKVGKDSEAVEYPAEFLSFLDEFVSNWMLLHEDLWITPSEVVNWTNLIKNGQPEKVDWAGLVWFMVEKELSQGPNLKDCYYASHLQHLIKVQREELFRESSPVELTVDEDEDDGNLKMIDCEEPSLEGQKSEEQNVELTLGSDCVAQGENVGVVNKVEEAGDTDKLEKSESRTGNVDDVKNVASADEVYKVEAVHADHVEDVQADHIENVEAEHVKNVEAEHVENVEAEHVQNVEAVTEHVQNADENIGNGDDTIDAEEESKDVDMIDFGYCKEDEQGQWLLDGKNEGHHYLQRCSMMVEKVPMEDRTQEQIGEDMEEGEGQEDGHVEGFKIMQKGALDGLSSANLIHAFEAGQLSYPSPELVMSSRADNNVMLGGPSMFNHAGKRVIGHNGNDFSHHTLNDNHKKMRVDGSWDEKPPDAGLCFEQIVHWAEKMKMSCEAAKEEAFQQTNSMNQQIFAQMEQREQENMQLRCRLEEVQRSLQVEVHRRDKELYLMNSVIDGYRRALKQTQREFAEYRKKYSSVPDEAVYKDAGSGGVVKSIMELERERIKEKEEFKRTSQFIEGTFKKELIGFELKWDELVVAEVQTLYSRLQNAAKEVELLKENVENRRASGGAESES